MSASPTVADVIAVSLAGYPVLASAMPQLAACLGHGSVLDSLMSVDSDVCDEGHIHSQASLMVLTDTELLIIIVADSDDQGPDPDNPEQSLVRPALSLEVEALPLVRLAKVGIQHGFELLGGEAVLRSVTLAVTPATPSVMGVLSPLLCGDEDCDSDHGSHLHASPDAIEFTTPAEESEAVIRFGLQLRQRIADLAI